MAIYRATRNQPGLVPPAVTLRPPRNVPFYVDNIWEWLRPEGFPSRRLSAFASSRPEVAAESAGCSLDQVYRVELCDEQAICQLRDVDDARDHQDIARLKRAVLGAIPRDWFALPHADRGVGTILFLPCATREEMDLVMDDSHFIRSDDIRNISKFWGDCILVKSVQNGMNVSPCGEIFFEGAYRLVAREGGPSGS